jgi:predicted DNA-binding transcriptional regulator AlpA
MSNNNRILQNNHVVTLRQASLHLNVSMPKVHTALSEMGCRLLPADRVDLSDVWRRMWRIDGVPLFHISAMEAQLNTVDQVAEMMGTTSQTIRKAGNSRDPKWNLPEHYDLGPRMRRYLPMHIEAWRRSSELEPWLQRRLGPLSSSGMVARAPRNQFCGVQMTN